MQGITEADGPYPYGDAIFWIGVGVCYIIDLFVSKPLVPKQSVPDGKTKPVDGTEETCPDSSSANQPPVPDVTYPGDDPAKSPGDDYEWRGPDQQGGERGGYANKYGKDSWHPNLDHGPPIGPHWDYNDPFGHKWRIFPDGIIEFVK